MDNKILGFTTDTFYGLLFLIVLIILGIVSFHYYGYVQGGNGSALSAGTGFGITLLPGKGYPEPEQRRM